VTVASPESTAGRFRRAASEWGDASPAFGGGRSTLGPRPGGRPPVGSFKRASTPGERLADQQRGALDLDLQPGDHVVHRQWGNGVVRAVSGQGDRALAEVDFPGQGRKRLLLRYAPLTKV
jgi:DNA helicase-2/ATP-dependent DNA helicase PcrA